jgi:hypothetical protein
MMNSRELSELSAVPIRNALDAFLSNIEERLVPAPDRQDWYRRIETCVPTIDGRNGGILAGEVTVVGVDRPSHADALAAYITIRYAESTLVVVDDIRTATRRLLAAAAGLPPALLECDVLGDVWTELTRGVGALCDRPIHLIQSASADAVLHAAVATNSRLCVVVARDQLGGDLDGLVHDLAAAVRGQDVAVLVLGASGYEADLTISYVLSFA